MFKKLITDFVTHSSQFDFGIRTEMKFFNNDCIRTYINVNNDCISHTYLHKRAYIKVDKHVDYDSLFTHVVVHIKIDNVP